MSTSSARLRRMCRLEVLAVMVALVPVATAIARWLDRVV